MADVNSLMEAMRERADGLSELGYKVRFELTDTGESILLDASAGGADVSQSRDDADAVLKLSTDTLGKLITGRIGPKLAFSTARLQVEGSQGVALKLAGLLDSD